MSEEMHRLHDYLNSPEYKEGVRRYAEHVLDTYGADVVEMAARLNCKREQEQGVLGSFLCQHCGDEIVTFNSVHTISFDDDGNHVQCITMPRFIHTRRETL